MLLRRGFRPVHLTSAIGAGVGGLCLIVLAVVVGSRVRARSSAAPTAPLPAGPVAVGSAAPAADVGPAGASSPPIVGPSAAHGGDRGGLTAANLLLIVNANEPAGRRLADFYAAQRHVPDGRILALDLPVADEVRADVYDARVVPAVRAFLAEHGLADAVTCLVTFYGVPLRVGPRVNTPAESAEYRYLAADLRRAVATARQAVAAAADAGRAPAVSRPADPAATGPFAPGPFAPTADPSSSSSSSSAAAAAAAGGPEELQALAARAEHAVAAAVDAVAGDPDPARRAARYGQLAAAVEALYGPLEAARRADQPRYRAASGLPPSPDKAAAAVARAAALADELRPLLSASARDPNARAGVRALAAEHFGALASVRVLAEQKDRLETEETEAAVDSELACLWWPDDRPRFRWADNPLYHRGRPPEPVHPLGSTPPSGAPAAGGSGWGGPAAGPDDGPGSPATLMVTRIDAPTEPLARELIATCVRVEAAGLRGGVAIDARGKPPTDPYGRFDQDLRDLAATLASRAAAASADPAYRVTLDDHDGVFPPGAVSDVALYCGWYSLRRYVPGAAFAPGAVGYHVASLELLSLHRPGERGWVRGLMADGVVATVGAVAEPYLHAFPLPTEFFPLLGTGRLTLAEVYWRTCPLVSWMTTCVGDPLYRPYAARPLVGPEAVSRKLRDALGGSGTR